MLTLCLLAGVMAAEESVVFSQQVVAVQLNSSEYALHAVFTQFEALADNKINLILSTNIVRTHPLHPSSFRPISHNKLITLFFFTML